jgi:curved DNA-binding protein CbpA
MTNHYEVLGLKVGGATSEQVDAAFDEVLAARRAKRQKTSDVHVAHAVLSDDGLRRTYDLALRGAIAGDRLTGAKDAAIEIVRDAIPEIDFNDVRRHAWQSLLRTTVLIAGATAKVSDMTGVASRQLQREAAKRIDQ